MKMVVVSIASFKVVDKSVACAGIVAIICIVANICIAASLYHATIPHCRYMDDYITSGELRDFDWFSSMDASMLMNNKMAFLCEQYCIPSV